MTLEPLQAGLSVLLFVVVALAWLGPPNDGAIDFTRSEVQFLFPAPVTRRQLIHYKLLRGGQVGALLSSIIFALSSCGRAESADWPHRHGRSLVLTFGLLGLHLTGVMLNLRNTAGRGPARVARQWLPLALVVAATVIVLVAIAADWPRLSAAATSSEIARELQRITATGPAAVVLWPFRTIARVALAQSAGEFLTALPGALVLLLLNVLWVLRSDASFEDGSVELAERSGHAARGQPSAVPRRSGPRRAPFALAPTGPVETAIFWKNLILARWAGRKVAVTVVFTAVAIGAVVVSSTGGPGRSQAAGILCTMLAAGVILLGPTMIRSDLRHDMAHLAVLKTWPVSGAALVRGEVLAPAALLSLLATALLVCAAALSGGALYDLIVLSGATRASFAVAAIVVAPAIITTHLLLHNAVAVIFPAWARIGPAGSGVDMMGQNMLVMAGTAIVLTLAIVPAALVAGVAAAITGLAAGRVPIVVPATVFSAALLCECLAATVGLAASSTGRTLPRLRPSSEAGNYRR